MRSITFTLTGQEKVIKSLKKRERLAIITENWMSSNEPDEIMNDSFKKTFSQEGRPKWKPLAEITKELRRKKGFGAGPILHRTGNLMDEITSLKGAVSGSKNMLIKEWGIKQLRSDAKVKFGAHQLGKGKKGQKLPKRRMIDFKKEDLTNLKDSLNKWIFMQLK